MIFEATESKYHTRLLKFKIASPIWQIVIWKNSWILIEVGILRLLCYSKWQIKHC